MSLTHKALLGNPKSSVTAKEILNHYGLLDTAEIHRDALENFCDFYAEIPFICVRYLSMLHSTKQLSPEAINTVFTDGFVASNVLEKFERELVAPTPDAKEAPLASPHKPRANPTFAIAASTVATRLLDEEKIDPTIRQVILNHVIGNRKLFLGNELLLTLTLIKLNRANLLTLNKLNILLKHTSNTGQLIAKCKLILIGHNVHLYFENICKPNTHVRELRMDDDGQVRAKLKISNGGVVYETLSALATQQKYYNLTDQLTTELLAVLFPEEPPRLPTKNFEEAFALLQDAKIDMRIRDYVFQFKSKPSTPRVFHGNELLLASTLINMQKLGRLTIENVGKLFAVYTDEKELIDKCKFIVLASKLTIKDFHALCDHATVIHGFSINDRGLIQVEAKLGNQKTAITDYKCTEVRLENAIATKPVMIEDPFDDTNVNNTAAAEAKSPLKTTIIAKAVPVNEEPNIYVQVDAKLESEITHTHMWALSHDALQSKYKLTPSQTARLVLAIAPDTLITQSAQAVAIPTGNPTPSNPTKYKAPPFKATHT